MIGIVRAETFSSWQTAHFTSAQLSNPAISGPSANPDADEFSNLMEYAFALDPFLPNRGNEALAQSFANGQFSYSYVQRKAATDLFYQFEYTDDLAGSWNLLTDFANVAAPVDLGTVWQQSVQIATHFPKHEFLRLRVLNTVAPTDLSVAPQGLSANLHPPFLDADVRWVDRSNVESGYQIERQVAPTGPWLTIATTNSDTTSYRDYHLASSTSYKYRARAQLKSGGTGPVSGEASLSTPLDSDGDNLSDAFEISIGTDPNKRDTDGDGLDDGYEVAHGTSNYGFPDLGGGTNNVGGNGGSGSPGDSIIPSLDPLDGDSDDNGIADGDEDWDEDGLTNSEEEDLGTYPDSIEIIPRYAVIDVGIHPNATVNSDYFGITDSGILVKGNGAMWKAGTTSSLGNVIVEDLSSSGWVAYNSVTSSLFVPALKNLNDQTTRILQTYTDAQAKARALATGAATGGTLTVTSKNAYVGAVSEVGIAAGSIWANLEKKSTDAQGNEIIKQLGVSEDVYWDVDGVYHSIKSLYPPDYAGLDGTTGFTAINDLGTILATLGEFNPDHADGSPVIWNGFTAQPYIIPNTGFNSGLNERDERLESVSPYSLEARLIGKTKTYNLDTFYDGQLNEAKAKQPDANGVLQDIPYTQIVGARPNPVDQELDARLWIKSIGKDEYVSIDLNKRVTFPTGSTKRLIYGEAISNNGLILASQSEITPSGQVVSDVILVPFELLDNQNKVIDAKSESLNVSNFVTLDSLPKSSITEFDTTCDDPDNFRIEVPSLAGESSSLTVKLEVFRPNAAQASYSKDYQLTKSQNGIFRSNFLRLVTFQPDDEASGEGQIQDPNEQTILVKLGDTLKLTYAVGSTGTKLEYSIPVARENAPLNNSANQKKHDIREVKLNIKIFKRTEGTFSAEAPDVQADVDEANQILAQANLRAKVVSISFQDEPAYRDGFVGRPIPVESTTPTEDEAIMGFWKSADANAIDVYYVPSVVAGNPFYARAYPAILAAVYPKNCIIMGASSIPFSNVLPHEIMHILLNSDHRSGESQTCLFAANGNLGHVGGIDDIFERRRIGPFTEGTSPQNRPQGNHLIRKNDTFTIRKSSQILP